MTEITNREERLTILKDVLKMMHACAFKPSHSNGLVRIGDLQKGELIPDAIKRGAQCSACVQGAIFIAATAQGKGSAISVDTQGYSLDSGMIRTMNRSIFGGDAAIAECAYEGSTAYASGAPPGAYAQCDAAAKWGHEMRYGSRLTDAQIMRAVVERMIANGGTFYGPAGIDAAGDGIGHEGVE